MKNRIDKISKSSDRYKIFCFLYKNQNVIDLIANLNNEGVNSINIGKDLAYYIDGLEDFSYLNIDVYDYIKILLDKHKSKINEIGNDIVAIYNLGILMEPSIELNTVQLLKEFSKSTALIIIWDGLSDFSDKLFWPTQSNDIYLDFTETPLKILQDEI